MDVVAARDDARRGRSPSSQVATAQGSSPANVLIGSSPSSTHRVSSRNSRNSTAKPPATAKATPAFSISIRPPENTSFGVPSGSMFCRNGAPASMEAKPQSA